MTQVDLIYFNAGGGHRASALALQGVLNELQLPWNVRLVNLFEVIDPLSEQHSIVRAETCGVLYARERLRFAAGHEEAVRAVGQDLVVGADPRRDDGETAGEPFENGHRKALAARGQDQYIGARAQGAGIGFAQPARRMVTIIGRKIANP